MERLNEQLNNWIKSLLDDCDDFQTYFSTGVNLIRLLQAIQPNSAPSSRYHVNPRNFAQIREARNVAVAFARELGTRGFAIV
jgi:hypothetical protein